MSVSIPRACSALCFTLLVAGCGAGEVTLELTRESPEVLRPGAVKVLFQILGVSDPVRFEPVPVDDPGAQGRRFADIPPGREMYADVFGCTSVDACGGADVVARGCSERFVVPAGASLAVPVILQLNDDGLATCDALALAL